MKAFLFVCFFFAFLSVVYGHARLSTPTPRQPAVENTTATCGNILTAQSPNFTAMAGKAMTWATKNNQHTGNGVYLYLMDGVYNNPSTSQLTTNAAALSAPGSTVNTNFAITAGALTAQIPNTTTVGVHTLVWSWSGWWSCAEINVVAYDGTFSCTDSFTDCNYSGEGTAYGFKPYGGTCNLQTGQCECLAGWTGIHCDQQSSGDGCVVGPVVLATVAAAAAIIV